MQKQIETLESEKAALATQLEDLQKQFTELSVTYEGLLSERNSLQKYLDEVQYEAEARYALAAENEETEETELEELPEVDPVVEAVLDDYRQEIERLEEACELLEIENALLREKIQGYID